jgi:hypothetical protein
MRKKLKIILLFLLSFSSVEANFFNHSALPFFIPNYRVLIESYIFENVSIIKSRVYFKSEKMENYSFVNMKCKRGVCRTTLPALDTKSEYLSYFLYFLAPNGQYFVSRVYVVPRHQIPDWIKAKEPNDILISYEGFQGYSKNFLRDYNDQIMLSPSNNFMETRIRKDDFNQNKYNYNYDSMMRFTP